MEVLLIKNYMEATTQPPIIPWCYHNIHFIIPIVQIGKLRSSAARELA